MLLIPTLLCPKSWEGMSGSDTQRFCTYCKKSVHNLEALSVSERLALLSSPAASVCSRYQVAIRRPVKGKEDSYMRHLAKCGAGVAVAGSVLLVLWEMHGRDEKERFYRAVANGTDCGMPSHLYREHRSVMMGDVALLMRQPDTKPPAEIFPGEIPHVDLKIDPNEIDRLTALPAGPKGGK